MFWKIWTVNQSELIMSGEGHKDWISAMRFHPRGHHLLTGSGDAARSKSGISCTRLAPSPSRIIASLFGASISTELETTWLLGPLIPHVACWTSTWASAGVFSEDMLTQLRESTSSRPPICLRLPQQTRLFRFGTPEQACVFRLSTAMRVDSQVVSSTRRETDSPVAIRLEWPRRGISLLEGRPTHSVLTRRPQNCISIDRSGNLLGCWDG